MKKITPVSGPQELFDALNDYHLFAVSSDAGAGNWMVHGFYDAQSMGDFLVSVKEKVVIAERRIEGAPEPERWTTEDQKAGRLPPVGVKCFFNKKNQGDFALHTTISSWINGDILEVLHVADACGIGISVFNLRTGTAATIAFCYLAAEEAPEEKAERLRIEWAKQAAKIANESERGMCGVYDAFLSGELSVPTKGSEQ